MIKVIDGKCACCAEPTSAHLCDSCCEQMRKWHIKPNSKYDTYEWDIMTGVELFIEIYNQREQFYADEEFAESFPYLSFKVYRQDKVYPYDTDTLLIEAWGSKDMGRRTDLNSEIWTLWTAEETLTEREALEWCTEHLSGDSYITYFKDMVEDA